MDKIMDTSELDSAYTLFKSLSGISSEGIDPSTRLGLHNIAVEQYGYDDVDNIDPVFLGLTNSGDVTHITTEGIVENISKTISKIFKWIVDKIKGIYKYIRNKIKEFIEWINKQETLEERLKKVPNVHDVEEDIRIRMRDVISPEDITNIRDITYNGVMPWVSVLGAMDITNSRDIPSSVMSNIKAEELAHNEIESRVSDFVTLVASINDIVDNVSDMFSMEKIKEYESGKGPICDINKFVSTNDISKLISDGRKIDSTKTLLCYGISIDKLANTILTTPVLYDNKEKVIKLGEKRPKSKYRKGKAYKNVESNYKRSIYGEDVNVLYMHMVMLVNMHTISSDKVISLTQSLVPLITQINRRVEDSAKDISRIEDELKKDVLTSTAEEAREIKDAVMGTVHACSKTIITLSNISSLGINYVNMYTGSMGSLLDTMDRIYPMVFKTHGLDDEG